MTAFVRLSLATLAVFTVVGIALASYLPTPRYDNAIPLFVRDDRHGGDSDDGSGRHGGDSVLSSAASALSGPGSDMIPDASGSGKTCITPAGAMQRILNYLAKSESEESAKPILDCMYSRLPTIHTDVVKGGCWAAPDFGKYIGNEIGICVRQAALAADPAPSVRQRSRQSGQQMPGQERQGSQGPSGGASLKARTTPATAAPPATPAPAVATATTNSCLATVCSYCCGLTAFDLGPGAQASCYHPCPCPC